jgi:pyruvate,water dikinase
MSAGVVALSAAGDAGLFGGKAAQLSAALAAGLPVPAGFALSIEALAALARADPATIERVCARAAGLGPRLAARSSALGEDSESASFAGQHLTLLNVSGPSALVAALGRVHASAQSVAALAYRKKRGISGPAEMAAVVQQLVEPRCAGVLFTRNPMTQADEYVIEASWGLGESVVAGLITPDHYRVSRQGALLEARVGEKDLRIECHGNAGTREVPVPHELAVARCLDAGWLTRLADLAARCEAHFGAGLDLEWACTAETLHLLQVRPISTGARG